MTLQKRLKWMNAGVVFSSFMVQGISGMSIIGYMFGLESFWKWTADGGAMGINTAITLFAIGCYMLLNGFGISAIIKKLNG